MKKNLSDITRDEWIAIIWIEDSGMGGEEREFIAVGKRTPDEAAQAAEDWDSTADERERMRNVEI